MRHFSRALEYLHQNDIPSLREILETHSEVIDRQEHPDVIKPGKMYSEKTLLHYACEMGLTDVVDVLLYEFNANPVLYSNCDQDLGDALPIHYAAYYNNSGCLSLLLEHPQISEMLNETDGLGLTPLLEAMVNRSRVVLSQLFSNLECDVNAVVEAGDIGADRTEADIPEETTPLCAAILLEEEEIALELLEKRRDVDLTDGFPLHLAAKFGMWRLVKLLLERGADPQSRDEKERPALYYAVNKGHLEVVRMFYQYAKKNKDVYLGENYREGAERCSLLHLAVHKGLVEIAHYLMWFPRIEFQTLDASGLTAYELAVREKSDAIIKHFNHKFRVDPNRRLPSISRSRKKSKLHAELCDDMDPLTATLLLGDESEQMGDELTEFILSQAADEEDDPDDRKLLMTVAAEQSGPTFDTYLNHPALKSTTVEDALEEDERDFSSEVEVKLVEKVEKLKEDEENISDASDSDDDDFAPEPPTSLIPAAVKRRDMSGQRLVPNYRGEQYGQGKDKKEERKKKRERDPTESGLHSSASFDLLNKKYREQDLPEDVDDEEKLAFYDEVVNQEMRRMQEVPFAGKKNRKAKAKPQTESDADFQSYIHRYDAHLDELAGEKKGNRENIARNNRFQFSFAKNPSLSFSDLPKVAFKFGTGLNSASDKVVNTIKVRSTGRAHNPFVGEVFVVLHTPEQLQNNGSEHAPTLSNRRRLGLSLVYRHARERRFLGGIPKESFLEKVVIKIPSFDEYLPHYQEKYGLSEERFLHYQQRLINARATEEQKTIIDEFLKSLMKYLKDQIEAFADETAALEEAEIVYDDWNNGFSAERPGF